MESLQQGGEPFWGQRLPQTPPACSQGTTPVSKGWRRRREPRGQRCSTLLPRAGPGQRGPRRARLPPAGSPPARPGPATSPQPPDSSRAAPRRCPRGVRLLLHSSSLFLPHRGLIRAPAPESPETQTLQEPWPSPRTARSPGHCASGKPQGTAGRGAPRRAGQPSAKPTPGLAAPIPATSGHSGRVQGQ